MKWYLRGEPRLFAFTWGHRPRIWVPFKELIKASSQGPPSEPAGPGELKGDSRPPAPFTLMCMQAQTRSGSASWMSPQLGVENSQVTSICGNVSSSPCRERLARTGYQHRGCWQDTDPGPARRKDLGFGLRRVTRLGDLRGVRRFRHGSFCSSENSLLSAGGNPEGRVGRARLPVVQAEPQEPSCSPPLPPLSSTWERLFLRASILPLRLDLHQIKVAISYLDQCNSHPNHLPAPQLLPP